ncbi:protein translocase SEC61 complex subunit gamma [Candidatus Woesearchaeota archaeon]|nr:protein translocase SEC61 complex subunit gamma [Candidatus Woesearchaeota archaeon]
MESEEKPSFVTKAKRFGKECLRVLRVTKKPNKEEFKTIVKVSGLGILIIGMLGFIIQMIKQLLF